MASTLLFILYCLEAGIFFILAPWTSFWTTNPLFQSTALVEALTQSFYLRGLISGFGLVHLLVGTREVLLLVRSQGQSRMDGGDGKR
ncbi:MAG: hypothetical protein R3338_12215 [Thermoanaerobaculia bacterium]|nr:hypothetical protein [Thermoanaerobaculia bacterium]